jgi:hypothetical protein
MDGFRSGRSGVGSIGAKGGSMDQTPLGTGASRATSRRRVLQSAATLATMAVVGDRQGSLAASRGWCRSDPFIAIEGVVIDIFCTAPLEAPWYVTGPTEIVVSVPVGVSAALVVAGVGFGHGEVVRFEEKSRLKQLADGLELEVGVYVPANRELPIGVELARNLVGILTPTTAEGLTNQWITLPKRLPIETLLAQLSSDTTPLAIESTGQTARRARDKRAHRRRNGKRERH